MRIKNFSAFQTVKTTFYSFFISAKFLIPHSQSLFILSLLLFYYSGNVYAQDKIQVADSYNDWGYDNNRILNGLKGGTGWNGAWTGKDSGATLQSPGLVVNGMQFGTRRLSFTSATGDQEFFRKLSVPIGVSGTTTAWISFTIQKNAGTGQFGLFFFKDGKEKLFAGTAAGNDMLGFAAGSATSFTAKTTHQVFIKINYNNGNDMAWLFIDPSSSAEPDVEGAAALAKGNFAFDQIRLAIAKSVDGSITTGSMGPIRIGNKFSEVDMTYAKVSDLPKDLGAALPVLSWKKTDRSLVINTSGGILKLSPFLKQVLKIEFGKDADLQTAKNYAVSRLPEQVSFTVSESTAAINMHCGGFSVQIIKSSSQVLVFDKAGKLLVQENPGGGRNTFTGKTSTIATRFKLTTDEALYGLGQFKDGYMNLRGKRRELIQMNTLSAVPVLLSTNGWGMFWDNPSRTIYADDDKSMILSSDFGKTISYYVFVGEKLDDIVADYRSLTGQAPMLPSWALGYHQSRNKYGTQEQVLAVAERMRKENIPINSVFIDYYYWGKYGTGSHQFDESIFPDVPGMIKKLHNDYHTKAVITVWPAFKPGTANYEAMNSKGYLLSGVRALDGIVYDPFNPKAAELYWKLIEKDLIHSGIDGWFLDGPEPDHIPSFLESTTFEGPAPTVRNMFSLFHSGNFYNGLLKAFPNRRPYLLTRCAWASQQKYGTAVWSGDIGTTFTELKRQIPAGLHFVATGIPYWTTDIGGYGGGNPEDKLYRETFTRWWQYGVFCPVFRSHGRRFPGDTKGFNELWAFGPDVQKICTDYSNLRYRLMPYVYTLTGNTTQKSYTPMRLLAFDFAKDKQVLNISDQFMYGPAFLINPITDSGAVSRKVYLPAGTDWINFWTGDNEKGGQIVASAAPIAQMPVYVRAGSIVPMGAVEQYTDPARQGNPLEIRIYAGANGSFELYEDDGVSFEYQKGKFSKIVFSYNDNTKQLTIGPRSGSFTGMPATRRFNIVWVRQQNGTGIYEGKADVPVKYNGAKLVIAKPRLLN